MSKRADSETVLIIEDDADIRKFSSRVLEFEGYIVLQAQDGETALEILSEKAVSLVLLDLTLPGLDGFAVLSQMKKTRELSMIPVIIFSASAELSQRERAFNAGAANYLVKPLSAVILKDTVAAVLHADR